MEKLLTCPHCHQQFPVYANPSPTVDCLIHAPSLGVLLIRRKNPPLGYALPGGFVDEGEWVENAVRREMLEETNLDVILEGVLGVYSRPDRDPRFHTLTTVFVGHPRDAGAMRAGDDASDASWYPLEALPSPLCFDHGRMLLDYRECLAGRRTLAGLSSEWLLTEEGLRNGS